MTFGVTPTGFVRMTEQDLVNAFEGDQLADIGDDIDLSADSLFGQQNGIIGRQLGICWEQLEVLYNGNDPEASEDRLLEMICKLTGTFRRGSTQSRVLMTLNLDIGTEIVAGETFVSLLDKPDIRFTPEADYTAVADGNVDRYFLSELYGEIAAPAGELNVIATPLVGWNSAVNANDAVLGLPGDLDPVLRFRRENELATVGSTTALAIAANIRQAYPEEISNLTVYENEGDTTDADGRPPHSVEVLIFDGEIPLVDNDALAQIIFDSGKAAGIQTYGNTSGTASFLVNGVAIEKTIYFSRATQLTTYVDLFLTVGAEYVGAQAVKDFVAAQGDANYDPGEDVVALFVRALPLQLAGVIDVTSCELGFSASPSGTVNLAVGVREIARFDTARITVTIA